jgi:hypothetical protein
MEEALAHRVPIPTAGLPTPAREAVATVKDLCELDTAKARDREERRRLHLDHDASFTPPTVHPRPRLTIDSVRGPTFTPRALMMVLAQYGLDRGQGAWSWRHLTRGFEIIKRRALVANS